MFVFHYFGKKHLMFLCILYNKCPFHSIENLLEVVLLHDIFMNYLKKTNTISHIF